MQLMEIPTWVAYSLASLLTIPLLLISSKLRRSKLNLPPGPKPWPIIGNFNLIGPLAHRSFDELSRRYGPIIMVHFGSSPVLVVSSAEIAKLVLKTHDAIFTGRLETAARKYTSYNFCDVSWSQEGPYWRQARKMCTQELFSPKRLESYEYIRIEELNSVLRGILEVNGKPIVLRDHLTTFSLNVISRMVLGKKYLDNNEGSIFTSEVFKKMIDEWFLLNGIFNPGDWIPCAKWVDVQGYVKRMKILARKFDRFLEHVLDEHIASRNNDKEQHGLPQDMIDVLMEFADDPKLQVKLEKEGLKVIIQDLITGGTETSALEVEWAMSELLRRPHLMLKARKELDHVVGKERWVQEKDMQNLPYIRAIMKETMRLHPVANLLPPRQSRKHVQINGYDIPKDTVMFVNLFTIQRDRLIYERPDEFWPGRFIGSEIDVKGQHFQFLPFGSGRRMCPGYSLGLKITELSLANILHGFTWKLPDNMKLEELDMEETFGMSNPKKIPLVVCAEPRLPPHLYHM